jgi:hypothetical protein
LRTGSRRDGSGKEIQAGISDYYLGKLKHYVEDDCGNDPAVLLSSGFHAASTTRDRSPLANPSILSVDLGNSAELLLKVSPIVRANCHEVRMAAMGAGNVPAPSFFI